MHVCYGLFLSIWHTSLEINGTYTVHFESLPEKQNKESRETGKEVDRLQIHCGMRKD